MTSITIRNLPDDLVRRMKKAAKRSGKSMEQEIRDLLEWRYPRKDVVLERMRERWNRIPAPSAKEVETWREEGRR
jgi:plasmid stability protein